MTQLTKQQYADLAKDAYEERVVTTDDKGISIGGNRYKVLAVHNNPKTDYQGAVYQDIRTKEIIVAHRGTESLIDAKVDLKMVLDRVNKNSIKIITYPVPTLPKSAIPLAAHSRKSNPTASITKA